MVVALLGALGLIAVAATQATAGAAPVKTATTAKPLSNPTTNRQPPLFSIEGGRCSPPPGSSSTAPSSSWDCQSPCLPHYDDFAFNGSPACNDLLLASINEAQAGERLPGFTLPSNFAKLTVPQQMFVLVNLERISRGVPPLVGLSPYLGPPAQSRGPRSTRPHFQARLRARAGLVPAHGRDVRLRGCVVGQRRQRLGCHVWLDVRRRLGRHGRHAQHSLQRSRIERLLGAPRRASWRVHGDDLRRLHRRRRVRLAGRAQLGRVLRAPARAPSPVPDAARVHLGRQRPARTAPGLGTHPSRLRRWAGTLPRGNRLNFDFDFPARVEQTGNDNHRRGRLSGGKPFRMSAPNGPRVGSRGDKHPGPHDVGEARAQLLEGRPRRCRNNAAPAALRPPGSSHRAIWEPFPTRQCGHPPGLRD